MSETRAVVDVRDVDDPPGVKNPMWEIVRTIPSQRLGNAWSPERRWEPDGFVLGPAGVGRSRHDLCVRFAWAITDPESVAFVAEHAGPRVVEVGAGTGYWAWQLAQRGVDVIAYDEHPPDVRPNYYHSPGRDGSTPVGLRSTWHPVLAAKDADASAVHSDRTLLLCWPPYDSPMAADTLAAYSGDRLIYIGEGAGGCTGDDRFHRMLGFAGWEFEDEPGPDAEWREVAEHCPVQWWGLHDRITVYERRVSP